ncbi:hypothetical protein BUALT_Bualt07G0003500 [Buddleja alternifolia]|uniref:BTB domain-containing protein n=1 Tax=Buddleja alternifolia TaxID=168488 RepID=A0AAV6X648_9LAMI|nr:hypothetical protein BUALT_Bualt07G0003500 [Buddleja alternifolia]
MVGGYEWKIWFFPNGKSVGVYNAGQTSLYLALRSNTKDRVLCLFEIHLIDQSGKGNHHGRSLFNTFPPDMTYFTLGHMDGLFYFIKQDCLEPSDYLKDDCLKINCSIQGLISRIEKLLLKNNADIFVKVAEETLIVQKSTLAAHSDVFRSLLSNAHQQHNEIVIPDTKPRTFECLRLVELEICAQVSRLVWST